MRKVLVLVVALVFAASACGGGTEYGSEKLRRAKEKEQERLGGIKKEESPTPASSPKPTQVATTKPPSPPPPAAPTVTIEITAEGYKPFNFRVVKGTTLKVVNKDNQARTFTADQGNFDSGSISPGAAWSYVANTVGTFNFHDETRPFVVGQMEVVSG